MNFATFYYKSNSSTHSLQGNVLKSTIEQIHQDKVMINTGLRTSFLCFQHELGLHNSIFKWYPSLPEFVQNKQEVTEFSFKHSSFKKRKRETLKQKTFFDSYHYDKISFSSESQTERFSLDKTCFRENTQDPKAYSSCSKKMTQQHKHIDSNFYLVGVDLLEKQSKISDKIVCSSPKSSLRLTKRALIWTELNKCRREAHKKSRINGFILNPVNGGFAVAIAGYIAFLPRSLCFNKKVFIGQWRQFSIISMNFKLANIVLKEIKTNTFSEKQAEKKGVKQHNIEKARRKTNIS